MTWRATVVLATTPAAAAAALAVDNDITTSFVVAGRASVTRHAAAD